MTTDEDLEWTVTPRLVKKESGREVEMVSVTVLNPLTRKAAWALCETEGEARYKALARLRYFEQGCA